MAIGTLLSEVQSERVEWLWQGRIPRGKITILDGDPGLGKSLLTLDLAARVSTGREMPDSSLGISGGVILVSGEDGLADTVKPRLQAARADLSRIVDLTITDHGKHTLLQIPGDLKKIEDATAPIGAVLLVIDPVYTFLNGSVNTDKDAQVRQALTPLAKLAERLNLAIVLVRHLNKAEEKRAIYRGGGSIAMIGLARSGLLVAKSRKSDGNVLATIKCNLAAHHPALRYRVQANREDVPVVQWLGESQETADELIVAPRPATRPSESERAEEFLRDVLCKRVSMPSADLETQARQEGISPKTYQRARKVVGVKSHQTRDGWISSLPTSVVRQSDGRVPRDGEGAVIGLA